ncbi:hypothetical protein ACLOJK_031582 [Asimina triloba]
MDSVSPSSSCKIYSVRGNLESGWDSSAMDLDFCLRCRGKENGGLNDVCPPHVLEWKAILP